MTHQHDRIFSLFAGFRDRIDRERLEARRTGVQRHSDPSRPQRFVTSASATVLPFRSSGVSA